MFDVEKFLSDVGVEYRKSGKNVPKDAINIKCIYCGETRFHLVLHKKKSYCNCWVCKIYKSTVEVVKDLLRCSWTEAREIVFGKQRVGVFSYGVDEYETQERARVEKCVLPQFTYSITKLKSDPVQVSARRYLMGRYVRKYDIWLEYDLHYGAAGEQAYRIVFPMYFGGQLVTYTGRDFTGRANLRYKTCSFENSVLLTTEILYGIDSFAGKTAILVEGPFDKVVMRDHSVLAISTDKLSTQQKNQLNSLELEQLIIVLDRSAYEHGIEIAEYFRPLIPKIKVVRLPKKDPGVVGRMGTYTAIRQTKWFDF